ncbi:hypothetical protein EDB85DRAFT_1614181 [Lactarius pseudohatsudake]|nr:hypothetical protein EDB85DRAFT_1614181 [Lactarius pseudohatsudake]
MPEKHINRGHRCTRYRYLHARKPRCLAYNPRSGRRSSSLSACLGRARLLEVCMRLNILCVHYVGISQISRVYEPVWRGQDEEMRYNFENTTFCDIRRRDRVSRYYRANIAVCLIRLHGLAHFTSRPMYDSKRALNLKALTCAIAPRVSTKEPSQFLYLGAVGDVPHRESGITWSYGYCSNQSYPNLGRS